MLVFLFVGAGGGGAEGPMTTFASLIFIHLYVLRFHVLRHVCIILVIWKPSKKEKKHKKRKKNESVVITNILKYKLLVLSLLWKAVRYLPIGVGCPLLVMLAATDDRCLCVLIDYRLQSGDITILLLLLDLLAELLLERETSSPLLFDCNSNFKDSTG